MSKRRKSGERVWVRPGAAFNASRGEWATIIGGDDHKMPCMLDCGDEMCDEWIDLESDDGHPFYHVSECEMYDEPQEE